jgi:hypothetical protein
MRYDKALRGGYVPFDAITWEIGREGRGWRWSRDPDEDEFGYGFEAMPEKIEATDGKLFYDEEERLKILGALLEHVGIDRVVRFGDPALWKAAVAELPGP